MHILNNNDNNNNNYNNVELLCHHLDEGVIKMVETEDPGRHSQLEEDTRDQETHSGRAQHLQT